MPSLKIEAIYDDADLIEVRVTAHQEPFAGAACVYVAQGDLGAAAETLTGFPRSVSDTRVIDWGPPNSPTLGAATLTFHCLDAAGHAAVRVALRTGDQCLDTLGQSVSLTMRVEPATIDRFIADLKALERRKADTAILEGVA